MFGEKFVNELFKPQKIYSNQNTRSVFDRLAHSSIMRLNPTSMDKLYDLMTMGFKYQVLTCVQPSEVIQVTLNHLNSVKSILTTSSVPGPSLSEALRLLDITTQFVIQVLIIIIHCIIVFYRHIKTSQCMNSTYFAR